MSFTFSEKATEKVVRATKLVLGETANGSGESAYPVITTELFFWATLSAETGSIGAYSYDFAECLRDGTAIPDGRTTADSTQHATAVAGAQCAGVVLIRMDFSSDTPTFTIVTPKASTLPQGLKKYMVFQMASDATVVSGVITVPGATTFDYVLAHS